jgi:hypothetical protein
MQLAHMYRFFIRLYFLKGLSPCVRSDQHFVFLWLVAAFLPSAPIRVHCVKIKRQGRRGTRRGAEEKEV